MASEFSPAPWPRVDFAAFGDVEKTTLDKVQKYTADRLSSNWVNIPHVTHFDRVDIGPVDEHRKALNASGVGAKLTVLPYVVKALAAALGAFPQFNASLEADAKTLVLKKYFHIGVAIDTPRGLVVGVVRNCDTRPLNEIATDIWNLSDRARTKGLPMGDMMGGCISVSSLGSLGGTAFTPIINAPEVAILGLSQAQEVAVRDGDGLAWRTMLPLSLSYDHRVINGADAARFVNHVKQSLANPDDLVG